MSQDNHYRTSNKVNYNQKQTDLQRYANNSDWNRGAKKNSQNVKIEESRDLDLYIEYVQWDFINNVLYKIGEKWLNITDKFKQEFTNTLQRWFIFINEQFNEVPKYEYYPILPKVGMDHKAAEFLWQAFAEKQFASTDHAYTVVGRIFELIETSHSKVIIHSQHAPLTVKYNDFSNEISVNKFKSPEIPRLKLLVKKAGLIDTAKMLLRYESFGNGSYQWGDPKEVHKVLYDKFHVKYEGFASPVNSRFIEYDDTHFCSLFPKTDAVFGSLGNFFDVDMTKHVGGWSVNPPFLNDLMKEVAIKINNDLDKGYQGYFFCTFPCWNDDEGWQILDKSKHLLKRFDLKPQHFVVQDAYGSIFKPKMFMNMFVLGELPPTAARLIELGNILIYDNLNAMEEICPW